MSDDPVPPALRHHDQLAPADQAALWERLRAASPARIALGRVGHAPPLGAVLAFQRDHARARDAVQAPFDGAALANQLAPWPAVIVASAAGDRATYLRRPDLGRCLAAVSARCLAGIAPGYDIAIVIADGLSATGVQAGAAALVRALMAELDGLTIAPVVIASNARVALGDEVGQALGARATVMVIGERPGLSVADSLGIYLTFAPHVGRADSERNCISNIHANGGLSVAQAAATLGRLLREAFRRGLSGVALKDDFGSLPSCQPVADVISVADGTD